MREASAFFARRAAEEIPEYPTALEPQEFSMIEKMLTNVPLEFPGRLAIVISFLFGQRLPDILQLHPEDVEHCPATGSICVTVRRGKVIRHVQPYCLHLPESVRAANALLTYSFQKTPGQPLFDSTTPTTAREILKAIRPDLEIRSVRRGGLQALALLGLDLSEIRRHYSKHSSDAMLLRYLAHGRPLIAQARLHHKTTLDLLSGFP